MNTLMKIIIIILLLGAISIYFLFLRKKPVLRANPQNISYTQVDLTENFGDNLKLKPEDWIQTTAINVEAKNPESVGLPPKTAGPDEIYTIAARLSELREKFQIPNDGVYCPICHIANIDLAKLHTPCPKCGRKLLKFGWD
jgi:hypothetical protein